MNETSKPRYWRVLIVVASAIIALTALWTGFERFRHDAEALHAEQRLFSDLSKACWEDDPNPDDDIVLRVRPDRAEICEEIDEARLRYHDLPTEILIDMPAR